eukprot:jgi/Tetstr1/461172/TSEL_006309.t1
MEINRPKEQQKAAVGAALDAPRGGKIQLPKIRTAITAEQIAGPRLPPAARPRLTDGRRPPRREEQAPQETTTTANMNINRPEEHQEAEDGPFAAAGAHEANTNADDAVICPPTRTLLALLEVREVWKARRSADSVRLELLDPEAARLLQDVCRDAVLELPFGD